MKKRIVFTFIFLVSTLGASNIEESIKIKTNHYLFYLGDDRSSFINWSSLYYYYEYSKKITLNKGDNFVQKALFEKRNLSKKARRDILSDILKIDIDNEMTVKELLEINENFKNSLTKLLYKPEILFPPVQAGYNLDISGYFPFLKKGRLLDLIIRSGHFIEREKLVPVKSRYKPQAYHKIIIEARHLNIEPSLFPKIYTLDKKGEKKLIFSLSHANLKAITHKGYVKFLSKVRESELNNKKIYYCSAISSAGTKGADIVISREDYVKYFGSLVSLQFLSQGELYIIAKKQKQK